MKILDSNDQKELLVLLRRGDEPAFNRLYKAYSKPLYLRILRMVKSTDTADELLQDLFVKLWQNRERIDPEKSFQSYMYTVAQNLVFNYFRKVAYDQALIKTLLTQAADHALDAEMLLEDDKNTRILREAIEQLSPQRRQVFHLCKIEGKSYEETSLILGISTATVNSHMTQSLRLVKDYMLKNYDTALLVLVMAACIATPVNEPGTLLHVLVAV